ncbi:MAG TPA: hypothetical protein VD810_04260, partial [Methylophilaceae bacterium]|nr:hypothetical protein [Methylophilaceae bacterium]
AVNFDNALSVTAASPAVVTTAATTPENAALSAPTPDATSSLLQQRLEAGQTWLSQSPESQVTVQFMGGANEPQMEEQLKVLGRQLDPDKIYIFRTTEGGRPFMIATYGSYSSWNAGAQARRLLPSSLQANQPKLRSAGGIIKETK